ncbi:hypothetical protein [Klebsiella michiganensis]|uniref:hypothetical protein n=1 Tax=Klebsiella michiganensis TaxID=1134687 RepID=UPI001FD2CDE9|nr:hypothetical protein [Klebsiella michiganensis]MDS7888467.1 hypothetical protein [Klebsiella michiganensis]MDV0363052.1 hypothetical protein [Klebsiella michiganensis]UON97876.1 hypothetical protein MT472_08195 [Klebsiella michiganensis]HBM3233416.1 hypothetical protein [Klebsiella michiganensis]
MGTRHLTCVVKNGSYKVAQYGQWDGYPSGQGSDILTFLRSNLDREKFLANLERTFVPSDEQIAEMNARLQAENKGLSDLYPSLSRDTGGGILQLIQDTSEPLPLFIKTGFAAESLFCEWAYVVDFDKGTFEVFKGFNKTPLVDTERFYGVTSEDGADGYQPVRHLKTYQLNALQTDDEFLAELEPESDD